jgi:hypothetical protein
MKRRLVALEPGEELVVVESITLEQARGLAGARGTADVEELHAALNDSATIYRWMLWTEDAPRPKLIREELKQLAEALEGVLAMLGERARRELVDALNTMPELVPPTRFPPGVIFPGTCKLYVNRLKEAAGRACADLPRGDGRPPQETLRWLCREVAEVYELFSGRRFTYNPRSKYSSSTEWVSNVVQLIDPEITSGNLSTVLRDLRKPPSK